MFLADYLETLDRSGELLRIDLRLEAGAKDKFENIGFRCVKTA